MTNLPERDREIDNQRLRRDNQIVRENNSASNGLMVGILLTSLIGLGLGAFFLFNRGVDSPAPAGGPTIIERTREVPVPQPQAPDVKPPDINITVPKVEAPPAPDVNVTIPSPAAPPVPDVNVTIPSPAASPAPAAETAPTGNATSTGETAPAQP